MDEEELLGIVLAQGGVRLDAEETAHVLKELEHLKTRSYDVVHGPTKARQLIPVDNDIDPGAETITYDQYDHIGMAAIIANYADDLPLVDVTRKQFTMGVVTLGSAYSWSVLDIERAAKARSRLIDRRADASRMVNRHKEDQIGAVGADNQGIPGFINHPNLPKAVIPHAGAWTGLTASQILDNLNSLAYTPVFNSLEAFTPDTIILSPDEFGVVSQKPVGTDNQMTILRSFLLNNPYIQNIDQWTRLTGAGDPAGTTPTNRIISYLRNPMAVVWNIPQEYRVLPPQPVNLAFKVPAFSRVSGIEWHYPISAAIMDVAQPTRPTS